MPDDRFIQLHLLVSYPPSNPNRDELGQPKTAIVGGTQRSRISSQSLKRAWRNSEFWKIDGLKIGTRTRELFISPEYNLYEKLLTKNETKAEKIAVKILSAFAKTAKVKPPKEVKINEKFVGKEIVTEQPIHFSDKEVENIKTLVDQLSDEPTQKELDSLFDETPHNIDLAMFGRMIAKRPDKNIEAAVQVGHAISINEVELEDDFFTAVDDLNRQGSAHMGEQEFVSAIYYLYLCIDNQLLSQNLGNDPKLTSDSLKALVNAAAMVAPSGKQNSYAHRAQAFYILAEKGDAQPRNLSIAFLKAMPADNPEGAIKQLNTIKKKFNTAYTKPKCEKEMNLFDKGILTDILNFVGGSNE
jgi:CRISPR system Cascade subunit CasC